MPRVRGRVDRGFAAWAAWAGKIDYDRDIRPILSNQCFKCHGPDAHERQSGLRLDDREAALKPAESGQPAIVPGKASDSALVERVFSADPDEQMPPPDSNKVLTDAQKELLKAWVDQGRRTRSIGRLCRRAAAAAGSCQTKIGRRTRSTTSFWRAGRREA